MPASFVSAALALIGVLPGQSRPAMLGAAEKALRLKTGVKTPKLIRHSGRRAHLETKKGSKPIIRYRPTARCPHPPRWGAVREGIVGIFALICTKILPCCQRSRIIIS